MTSDFRDECGVFAIYGEAEAANHAYLGLHALQHRGREGAGIAVSDGHTIQLSRGRGLVSDVFDGAALATMKGHLAIGHVRFSRTGEDSERNIQPFLVRYRSGQVAVAHNGNIVNASSLREDLEAKGSIFGTLSDAEVVLHLLASSQQGTFVNRLVDALGQVQGAYAMVLCTESTLVAVRDPHGFRPLVLGRKGKSWVVCSETCALDLIGGEYVRDVAPGEMVIIDREGLQALRPFPQRPTRACVFEHVTFSRPDSTVFGRSVYETRVDLGRILATEQPVDADVVVPVPDSGLAAGLGYAETTQIPYRMGLLRSHYLGGQFLEPSRSIPDFGVRLKLSPVRSVVAGQRVVLVDDSLVRGTTAQKVIRILREAGASEVHLRVAAPPTTGSCFYGVDTPTREELLAHRSDHEGIRQYLGCDSLGYLSLKGLRQAEGHDAGRYCEACFSGDYPIDPSIGREDAQVPLFGDPVE